MPMARDLMTVESGRAQQLWNRVAEIAGHVVIAQHPPSRHAVVDGHIATDVDDVQSAAWTQYTKYFRRCIGFHVVRKMVEHHRRQHPVELAVRVGQLLRIALIEADAAEPPCFSSGSGQRTRVGVAADYLDARMSALGAGGDIAGPATDLQNTLSPAKFGLRDEGVMDSGHAE